MYIPGPFKKSKVATVYDYPEGAQLAPLAEGTARMVELMPEMFERLKVLTGSSTETLLKIK